MHDICLIGAGRIAQVHAASIAATSGLRLRYVVDIQSDAAASLAAAHGAQPLVDAGVALEDPQVAGIVIASATHTHVDYILQASKAGKAIFCEKPVDLDIARVNRCLKEIERAGTPLYMGFNRRFDPSFAALRNGIKAGRIGTVETVCIISRDPAPPPLDYIKVSGGLFRDMTIHDFDMARWLLGAEPVDVFAAGSCLVDPEIGVAGDVDTAVVSMRTATGVLCQIHNSRRSGYGYDQRIEVLGSKGMLQAANPTETTVSAWAAGGVTTDPPLDFFLERYERAYRAEMDEFACALNGGDTTLALAEDGRRALLLADAASQSAKEGGWVSVG